MMHEYYIFPMSCIGDLQEMEDDEKNLFLQGIMHYWKTGGYSPSEYYYPIVRVALRHAIREIEEIKEGIPEE